MSAHDRGVELMRIGLFAHRLAEANPTGTGRYVRELGCALARLAGAEHELLVVSTPEPTPVSWGSAGLAQRQLPWPRRPVQLSWCLGAGPRLERAAGALDVLHLTEPFPPVPSVAPQVLTVHDLFPLEHPGWYPLSERVIYRASIRWTLHRAQRIVAPSRHVAGRLVAVLGLDPSRIEVVHHGVSGIFGSAPPERDLTELYRRFAIERGGYAVSVGAVSARKNLVALSRAVARLAGDALPLVLVGPDGVGAQEVRAEIARLDGSARVVLTGYLPDEELAGLVEGAAALVHPSLTEGFGLVPLEAMAAGTPVIASRTGSIPEVVGSAGILVDEPSDPDAWARALVGVLRDPGRRQELAAAGRERASEFSWTRTARAMLEIYRDAAER